MIDDRAPITRDEALDVAHRIARRLIDDAQWSGDACTWEISTIEPMGDDGALGARRTVAGASLYQGTAGIGLFLAECARLTGDSDATRAAAGAFRHAVQTVVARSYQQFGFYSGDAGVAYALHRYALCCGSDEFADVPRQLIAAFAGNEHADKLMDVVSGVAGTLLGALALHGAIGDVALDVARRSGDHILAKARRGAGGWSWVPSATNARDLTGLAHGAAGIAQALLELAVLAKDEAYLLGAEQGFAYEREFKTSDNWLDLRHAAAFHFARRNAPPSEETRRAAADAPPYSARAMIAWCHGAPGIALARLRAYALLGRAPYRADAEMAVATARQALLVRRATSDFSLCHGASGLSELLLVAAPILNDPGAETEARRIAAVARSLELGGARWPCGMPDGSSDPSLFLGESGIGHHYLRLASADVPSVLLITASSGAVSTTVPQPVDPRELQRARAIELRRDYVHEHFGRVLRVLARFGVTHASESHDGESADAAAWSETSEVERAFASIDARIGTEADPRRRTMFSDAFAPERARFMMHASIPARSDEFLARVARPPSAAIDWDSAAIELRQPVQLVETHWSWDDWLDHPSPAAEPEAAGEAFLVHCRDAATHLLSLTPVAAAVIRALVAGGSLEAITAYLANATDDPDGDSVDQRRAAWQRIALAQVRELHDAGFLTVRSMPTAHTAYTEQAIHA